MKDCPEPTWIEAARVKFDAAYPMIRGPVDVEIWDSGIYNDDARLDNAYSWYKEHGGTWIRYN